MVKFPNDECLDATNQTGVCYSHLECKAFGGVGSTACAKGYGTCCSIRRSCNQATSNKVTYFTNPSYPNSDTTSTYCAFTVEVRDPHACQIRIDFLEFNVDQPTDGLCLGDRLTVTAGGLNARSIPILCGNNKDQHMYVNIPGTGGGQNGQSSQRSASLLMQTNGNGAYRWRMRITHVTCTKSLAENLSSSSVNSMNSMSNSLNRRNDIRSERMLSKLRFLPYATLKVTLPAPSGCLQYHSEPSGTIMSFNYGQYLANMDYAICIERLPTTCKVIFRAVDKFGISMFGGARQFYSGVGDADCLYDYLSIPGGALDGSRESKDRHCGTVLSNYRGDSNGQVVVSRSNGPIVLRFHTDSQYDRTVKAGFKLMYEQSSNCEQVTSDPNQPNLNANNQNNPFGPYMYPPTPVSANLFDGMDGSTMGDMMAVDNKVAVETIGSGSGDRESRSRANAKRWKF